MGNITPNGLKRVEEAHDAALKRVRKAREDLDVACEQLDALREAMECEHENLADEGCYINCQTRCKDCGFVWID